MKNIKTIITLACILLSVPQESKSLSFEDALSLAYNNNPFLQSAREDMKRTDEQMPQAISGFLPTITANAERGTRDTTQSGVSIEKLTDTKEISINQPLFRGGQTYNNIKLAKNIILSAREELRSIEQDVMLEAITAYADITRDIEVLELTQNNVEVLKKHLEVTTERFELGEVTKTDVAQAESGVAVAKSEMISAEGVLETSKARFVRIVGEKPGILEPISKNVAFNDSLDELLLIATAENPTLLSAMHEEVAAKNKVNAEKGRLLPTVSFRASKDKQQGALFTSSDLENERFTVNVSIPIYQSGSEYSRIRQAKFNHGSIKLGLEDQKNKIRESVIEAFNNFHVSRAVIKSNKAAIEASKIALEGTQEEAKFGARTTLDVLDAEQELFESKANLIRSQRDEIVSSYTLLSLIGRLNPSELGLDINVYDPKNNYNKRKYQIIGF